MSWKAVLKTHVDFRHDSDRPKRYGVYNIPEDKIIMNLANFNDLLSGVGEGEYDLNEEEALEMIGDRISHEAIHAAQTKIGEMDEPNIDIEKDKYGLPTKEGLNDMVNMIRRKAFRLLFNEITARLPEANNNFRQAINYMWRDLGGYNLGNSTYHQKGDDLYATIFNNALNEMIKKLMRRLK